MNLNNITDFIRDLRAANSVVIDTETTGLQVCRGKHVPFLFTARVGDKSYCFDFRDFLVQLEFVASFNELLERVTDLMIVGHNIKFDMNALENIGIVWPDYDQGVTYYCTASGARILNNLEESLSLDALSKKYCGIDKKDDSVTEWFKNNKKIGITPATKSESGKSEKHFDRVPNEILIPYAIQDVVATQALFKYQEKEFQTLQSQDLDLFPLLLTEMKVTYATYKMEQEGMLIDKDFINDAIKKENKLILENKRNFELLTGRKYIDSAKNLTPIFVEQGIELPKTDKGNTKIDEATLLKYEKECELIKYILAVRNAEKRLGTYLENFLLLCGKDGRIHPSFNQAGTASGRFSSSNPNAQNLSKNADDAGSELYPIRGCFVAPEGYTMLAVDADQQEYRLLADLAGEHVLIDKIKSGLDVHQATANMLGVTRAASKAFNFGLLYGMGVGSLANKLKVDITEAQRLRSLYFQNLPEICRISKELSFVAQDSGSIINWAGRRLFIESDRSYTAVNYYIQGGCADIIKKAIVDCHERLRKLKSKMIATIHDEIVFLVAQGEEHLFKELPLIMERAYPPRNGLRLTASGKKGQRFSELE